MYILLSSLGARLWLIAATPTIVPNFAEQIHDVTRGENHPCLGTWQSHDYRGIPCSWSFVWRGRVGCISALLFLHHEPIAGGCTRLELDWSLTPWGQHNSIVASSHCHGKPIHPAIWWESNAHMQVPRSDPTVAIYVSSSLIIFFPIRVPDSGKANITRLLHCRYVYHFSLLLPSPDVHHPLTGYC